ncbi:MAG: hypothetical protein J4431_03000 [Candidatus Aenigmarchaeota archaeon]|nr:hypothetical protein [Candidatus Aenigmarchaeota archaeon]
MNGNYDPDSAGIDRAMAFLGVIVDVFDDSTYMSPLIRAKAIEYIMETGKPPVDDRIRKMQGRKCDIPGMHYMDGGLDIMENYLPIPDKETGEPYVGVLRSSSFGERQFEIFTERQLDVLESRNVMNKRDAVEDRPGRVGGW